MENDTSLNKIFQDPKIQRHSSVAAFKNIGETSKYIFYNYDLFGILPIYVPKFVWIPETQRIKNLKDIFISFKDFKGKEIQVATNLYVHYVNGKVREDDDPMKQPNDTFTNYWGFEIDMLKESSKLLNFTYKIWNEPEEQWGSIGDDGKWFGLVEMARSGSVDFSMCTILQTYQRYLILDGTVFFEKDYLTFVAPKPTLIPQYFAIVNPFTFNVWIGIIISLFVVALILYLISKCEGPMIDQGLIEWKTFNASVWYTYGTLIGESITRDTKTSKAVALRWVVGTWIIFCFVMMSAYGGELKAYLTQKSYTSPIATLQDILESGLPWGMIFYGELEQQIMETSSDPTIKAIWDGMTEFPYTPKPPLESVYNGELIFIDYKSGLENTIAVEFATPLGDPLVYMAPDPLFMVNWIAWSFYPFSPYRPAIDLTIQRFTESGLISFWVNKAIKRINSEFLETGGKKKEFIEKPLASPLTVGDMQGIFYMLIIPCIVAFICFILYEKKIMKKIISPL